jgi:hypothetical protein
MILACPGLLILTGVLWMLLTRPLILHIPDGERPFPFWSRHRANKWYKRLDTWEMFGLFLGAGLVLGGIIGALAGV